MEKDFFEGGALSVDKLIEEKAPSLLKTIIQIEIS